MQTVLVYAANDVVGGPYVGAVVCDGYQPGEKEYDALPPDVMHSPAMMLFDSLGGPLAAMALYQALQPPDSPHRDCPVHH